MKLKKKIQNSMILVVLTSLILTYGTMIFVVYYQTMEILKNEIQQEADYIEAAVCISGVSYLEDMDAVRENTRVTLIDASGEVLYDSGKQEEHLENHLDRPEIQEALKSGSGQDVRRSETLDQDMFYYAVRLDNGTVLRVSKNMETVQYSDEHSSDDGSSCMLYGDICLASCKMADCQINLPDQSFESCRTVGK